ncbi:Uncharacterized protein HZ326_29054 [Fusarium oxysporum f. sp. albedinis]|nr:Uncharacterized protein HZ326_29054 [Fusarium oxysporum f. sp. albedinis]
MPIEPSLPLSEMLGSKKRCLPWFSFHQVNIGDGSFLDSFSFRVSSSRDLTRSCTSPYLTLSWSSLCASRQNEHRFSNPARTPSLQDQASHGMFLLTHYR